MNVRPSVLDEHRRERAGREREAEIALLDRRVVRSPRVVAEDVLLVGDDAAGGFEDDAVGHPELAEAIGGGLEPGVGAFEQADALIEHERAARAWRLAVVDQADDVFHRVAVEPRHQEDIVGLVRERLRLGDLGGAEEIGIVHAPLERHGSADHAAIQERQLRVDAGGRAVQPAGARDPNRHTSWQGPGRECDLARRTRRTRPRAGAQSAWHSLVE